MKIQSVCDISPQKTGTHQVRLMAGGNLIKYPGYISTLIVDIMDIKLIGT